MQRMTSMERAFHLARSGRFTTLTEMVTTLDREGFGQSNSRPASETTIDRSDQSCASGTARQRPRARRPGQLSNGRTVSWERLRVAKRSSLTAMSPRTHGPLQRPGSVHARQLAAGQRKGQEGSE